MIAGEFEQSLHGERGAEPQKRAASIAARVLAFLWAALLGGGLAAAAEKPPSEADLDKIRQEIAGLQKDIRSDTTRRDTLAARLRDAELTVAEARRQLDEARAARAQSEHRRAELQEQKAASERILDGEREALAGELRAAYMVGRQEQLKLLLNQKDPARMGLMLTYYGYFGRSRATRIDSIRAELDHLAELERALSEESTRLAGLEDQARSHLQSLQQARRDRSQVLDDLDRQLKTRTAALGQLKKQEGTLEKLLADLRRVVSEFPVTSEQPFEKLKGRLSWPVSGKVASDFGQRRAGTLNWNGVLLSTERGSQVRAVYFGRVIYADWLTGLGLLLILEHSGGYLTLYGHNEQLFKSVGDWVAPGDVIATVGDSGGRAEPELYFELRKGSKPLNPHQWMSKGPTRR
jgi:septal ring factor EnvC (AmiA/AmiB activator)